MTEQYVKVYLKSLKAKFDAYRLKKMQTYACEMITKELEVNQCTGDADGGGVEERLESSTSTPYQMISATVPISRCQVPEILMLYDDQIRESLEVGG
jgi:hypothetical protein